MAGLHVLTHIDIVACPHGGVVDLISGLGKTNIRAHNNHVITESELLSSLIYMCTSDPPCKKVIYIQSGTSRDFHGKNPKDRCLVANLVAFSNTFAELTWASPASPTALRAMIKLNEGYRRDVYGDTADPKTAKPTTGVGFNLDSAQYKGLLKKYGVDIDELLKHFDRTTGKGDGVPVLDDDVINSVLDDQLKTATDVARGTFGQPWNSLLWDLVLTDAQKAALTDLAYNFGHIPNVIIDPINNGDYAKASQLLKDTYSKWYHAGEQNGRAMRVLTWLLGTDLLAAPDAPEDDYILGDMLPIA